MDEDSQERDDPALAFERLRGEVSLLRHAVEALTTAPPFPVPSCRCAFAVRFAPVTGVSSSSRSLVVHATRTRAVAATARRFTRRGYQRTPPTRHGVSATS